MQEIRIVSNPDPLMESVKKPRGKKKLVEEVKKLREQVRRLDDENKVLRLTLRIMGGEVGVRNREKKKDMGQVYEYAEVLFPLLFPAGWRRSDNGYIQREIEGVPHAAIRVMKKDS